jgi:hypothetical protein
MMELDDRMLAERLAPFAASAHGADWNDVVRRAQRGGRARVVVAGVAAALAVAVAAPAFGLHRTVVDWLTAEPAPEREELAFSSLDESAPPGLETGVIPGTARKAFDAALPEGMRARVWLAPTAGGGHCKLIRFFAADGRKRGGVGPGCDDRRNATGYGVSIPGPVSAEGVIERGPVVIDGHATIRDATAAVIQFQDGTETEIPLTWVSKPIDAGFFVYGVPPANWEPGRRPVEVRFVGARGDTVGQTFTPRIGLPLPRAGS